MAAQPKELDPFADSQLASRSDLSAGIDFLIERGVLSRVQRYAGVTRVAANRLITLGRSHGVRAHASTQVFEAPQVFEAHEPLPKSSATRGSFATFETLISVLREILIAFPSLRSALFVPAPALSAFAVANLELPIVYGSGLLRRTPRPIAVVPWQRELRPDSVLHVIRANSDSSAVLLANRGVIAYSDESFSKLAKFVVSLEESAQLTINAHLLGRVRPLPADAYEQMQQGIAGD